VVLQKSPLLRQFASASNEAAGEKNLQVFVSAKPKKPTHPKRLVLSEFKSLTYYST